MSIKCDFHVTAEDRKINEKYFQTSGLLELWCMIETAKGVQNVDSIARIQSVLGLVFGSNDLTKDLRARHTIKR